MPRIIGDRRRFGLRWLRAAWHGFACCVALAPLLLGGHATARVRPNIVIMLTDDQRWDALGVVQRELGGRGRFPWLKTATPNMDRLAAEGFRFRNAFVVSSLCSPSRAAFLTGRYSHLNGVVNNHTPFPVASTTYATLLRAAGYRTGYFGKWHMGDQHAAAGLRRARQLRRPGPVLRRPFLVNGDARRRPPAGSTTSAPSYAIELHPRATPAEPFLMVLGFKSPALRRTRRPPRLERPVRIGDARRGAERRRATRPYDPSPVPAAIAAELVRDYFRTLVGVDQNVGRVLDALDEAGVADDTVVVFASDNGYFLGEHGIRYSRRRGRQQARRVRGVDPHPAAAPLPAPRPARGGPRRAGAQHRPGADPARARRRGAAGLDPGPELGAAAHRPGATRSAPVSSTSISARPPTACPRWWPCGAVATSSCATQASRAWTSCSISPPIPTRPAISPTMPPHVPFSG